ncbi:MAG: Abi family protein [Lachnospiraceae bacterium]|nr:Abi family protein [Lachnospiraceae bacterium]
MEKVFLDYTQQIKILVDDKNLNISDLKYAREMLGRYGYYSLINGYKNEFKDPITTKYRSNVCFEDIVALYEFDENLRALFLRYIQKIERQMKEYLSFYFCEKYGEKQEGYLRADHYNYINKNRRDIDKLIRILQRYTEGHTDYRYINHAVLNYGNVPLWIVMNALTFGNISKFYSLVRYDIQAKISINYEGVNEGQIAKIMIVLTGFRNVCAHGERLYCYRTKQAIPDLPLHEKMRIPKFGQEYACGKHDLFAVVIAMRYLLPNDWFLVFKRELIKTISRYLKKTSCFTEAEVLRFMGFPENWKTITRYRKRKAV